jgi:hypothetical protein
MTVIDVHTHMFTTRWLELLKQKGGIYNIQTRPDGQKEIFRGNTPVVLPQKGHFDWELRIQHMDQAKVDVSRPRARPTTTSPRRSRATRTGSAGSPRCPGSTRNARWRNWSAAARKARSA